MSHPPKHRESECLPWKSGDFICADQFNGRAVIFDVTGKIKWSFGGTGPTDFSENSVIGINDAQVYCDKVLMCGTGIPAGVTLEVKNGVVDNRVLFVDSKGNIEFQYGKFGMAGSSVDLLDTPVQAVFISCRCGKTTMKCPGSSILIVDQNNNRIIRVNGQKEIIWSYPGPESKETLNAPNSVQKLKCNRYLIADSQNHRAIEIDGKTGQIIKIFSASGTLGVCDFASRLPNGNTLLTDSSNNKIIEVDPSDVIQWQYITNAEFNSPTNPMPSRAVRLCSGDTLISNQFSNQVILVNETAIVTQRWGLPLSGSTQPGTSLIQTNHGIGPTTQLGLYGSYSAYQVDDYFGLSDFR